MCVSSLNSAVTTLWAHSIGLHTHYYPGHFVDPPRSCINCCCCNSTTTPPYSCLSLSDRKRNDFQVSGAAREMDLSNMSVAGNEELIIIYRSIELMFRITSRKMLPVAIFLIYSNRREKKGEEEGSKEHCGHFSFLL